MSLRLCVMMYDGYDIGLHLITTVSRHNNHVTLKLPESFITTQLQN